MWVTPIQYLKNPIVYWGSSPLSLNYQATGTYHTYDVGHFGFHGNIYVAYMTDLSESTDYYYKVGDTESKVFSDVKTFKTAPP